MLERMMETGMSVARMNFSHGSHEYHAETIRNCREAEKNYSARLGIPFSLAIALDTKGPEIRTGLLEGVSNFMYHQLHWINTYEIIVIIILLFRNTFIDCFYWNLPVYKSYMKSVPILVPWGTPHVKDFFAPLKTYFKIFEYV